METVVLELVDPLGKRYFQCSLGNIKFDVSRDVTTKLAQELIQKYPGAFRIAAGRSSEEQFTDDGAFTE